MSDRASPEGLRRLPKWQELLDTDCKLHTMLAEGSNVDSESAHLLVQSIMALSPDLEYIEDRQRARAILRFWSVYLSSRGEHAPEIDIDTKTSRPSRLRSFERFRREEQTALLFALAGTEIQRATQKPTVSVRRP